MPTPTHEKKLRADSKLAALAPALREELADMLLTGACSQADALEWLRGHGVSMCATSLAQYYRTRILPTKWQRMNVAAAELTKVGAGRAKDAARRAIIHKVFEMATSQDCDVKQLTMLARLMLDGESSEQAERKLTLLEQKEQAARAALKPQNDGRSAEDKLAEMRRIFGLH